jgi:hypothetical protein
MLDHAIRCIIQTIAAICWPVAVVPSPPQSQPCDAASNATHAAAPAVDHAAAARNRATGRGNEAGARRRWREIRQMARTGTGRSRLALLARRAARLTARGGLAGRAGPARRIRRASVPAPVAMSATASTSPDASTATAGRIGWPVATAAPMTTAPAIQPVMVTATTTARTGAAAGLASQADIRPGWPGCADAGQNASLAAAVPSCTSSASQPLGPGYRPTAGESHAVGSPPGEARFPLMGER